MFLPIIVAMYVFFLPESPRWLLNRARKSASGLNKQRLYRKAFDSLIKLRPTKLQAARDLFLLDQELELYEKEHANEDRSTLGELYTESKKFLTQQRSRWALLASSTCMFFQQVRYAHRGRRAPSSC